MKSRTKEKKGRCLSMRNDKTEWMDHLISEEMHRTADPLAPSPALKSRIEDALAAEKISPVRKGAYSMKRIPKLIVVAAACMMLAAGVYAGGVLTGTIASSHSGYDYRSYADLKKAENRAGYSVKAPEQLAGDYRFEGIRMVSLADTDDSASQRVNKRTGIDVTYRNSKGEELELSTDPKGTAPSEEMYQAKKETENGTFYYAKVRCLFLPADSRPTAEEAEREKNDPFFCISYGSSKKYTTTFSSVSFVSGNVSYTLLGENTSLSSGDLISAAASVLQ